MATHASRRTDKTGKDFENFVYHLLDLGGYNVEDQVNIGLRPTGGAHNTDIVVDEETIISLKYQDVAGTAEEKIPYEQICLQHGCETYGYKKAYILLAGPGWKHDQTYIDGGLNKWMTTPNVEVIDFDTFLDTFELHETFLNTVL